MNILKLIIILLFSITNGVSAMESMMGNISLNDQTYKSLNIMGTAKLNNVIIEEDLKVVGPSELKNNCKIQGSVNLIGPLKATGIVINSGKVVGPFEATDLNVEKELLLVGPVECKRCKFNSQLVITAKKCTFKDSELASLLVKEDGEKKKQYVYLEGKTVVHGDVVVEQADAEVVVEKGARVEGKIIKGKK
ncbi:MAG: hypothetical protein HQK49_19675 [Oligoflexia bacterium]|nr:hypothetical protein [Oligoflexia bacterium]